MDSNLLIIHKAVVEEIIIKGWDKITAPQGLAKECLVDENANEMIRQIKEIAAKHKTGLKKGY